MLKHIITLTLCIVLFVAQASGHLEPSVPGIPPIEDMKKITDRGRQAFEQEIGKNPALSRLMIKMHRDCDASIKSKSENADCPQRIHRALQTPSTLSADGILRLSDEHIQLESAMIWDCVMGAPLCDQRVRGVILDTCPRLFDFMTDSSDIKRLCGIGQLVASLPCAAAWQRGSLVWSIHKKAEVRACETKRAGCHQAMDRYVESEQARGLPDTVQLIRIRVAVVHFLRYFGESTPVSAPASFRDEL